MGELYSYDTEYTKQCRKQNNSRYMREYRKRNPQKTEQHRITSEIRHLEKLGYTIKAPATRENPSDLSTNDLDKIREQKRLYAREWRAKNRDHVREYSRNYRKSHPVKISPEKRREYSKRWREKNRDHIREYARQWYYNNPEKAKALREKWRAQNPGYEKLRWARYKHAFEQAKREQYRKIRQEIREAEEKRKAVSGQ